MFHIGYDIIEKCNNIELYRPDTVYKVYNCLQLLEDIELNTKEYFYINDIEQIVLHKDKNYIYFAPGLSNIPFTQKNNLILSIKNEKHNISCDKDSTKSRLLVGSLVVSNLNHKNVYRKNDKITIFCNNKSYSSTITDVIIKRGLYIHNQSDIIIHYKFNNTLLDVLNKSNNIYIQSTSNIKKDINIELRLNIKGGSPVLVNEKFNRVPKYFCKIFENNKLIFDDMINSYHIHPLKNNTYDVVITDSLNNTPTISNNNIAINNTSITINLADTIKIQNLLPQSSYSVAPQISTVFNSILQSKLR